MKRLFGCILFACTTVVVWQGVASDAEALREKIARAHSVKAVDLFYGYDRIGGEGLFGFSESFCWHALVCDIICRT